MILRGYLDNTPFILSLKPHSLAISLDDRYVVSVDRGGRLYHVYDGGHTYRRGLNGRVLRKWTEGGTRQRAWVAPVEADAIIDCASSLLNRLARLIRHRHPWSEAPDPGSEADVLEAIDCGAHFDSRAARRDAERFADVYRPIGILPPDQYLALVLQATEGCSFSTCTFCDLYHEPFRVKTPGEFARHVAAVRAYLGASLGLRARAVFLGSANALAVSMSRLQEIFEVVRREFPEHGVFAFVDGFTGTRKTVDDYRVLRDLGLRRVYVGLESGHDALLDFVRKPGRARDIVETVRTIKAAGLHVSVIVMIGLGGDRFANAHVADTAAVLRAMALGPGDLLYFSDLVEVPGTAYPALRAAHGIRPLTAAERAAQRQAIGEALAASASAPQMATYDVREFVY